ncbi:hypothetical protein QWY99_10485 [Flavobacterium branchiarum]|uniref:Uncharacterized protein n=1 Tax=Flavobacterium branchiarum TaxID=1114870 RepID=A0ABV5FS72_9FLAO|nr:hypothetical protein [Flavobacterium branchiarum]MDN3673480.1 hypothetical protein [Flavobacterium branchiarum]
MKKSIIYIFIFLITSNIGVFQQFYKLPVLFQHFNEHIEIKKVSFIDFLEMHYWGEDQDDDDGDRDMQLPFKNISGYSLQLVFIPTDKHAIYIPFNTSLTQTKGIPYTCNLYANPALFSVFRPPVV